MERLQDRFHCIACDTPGFGQSDPLPAAWNEPDLRPYVRALAALVESLGLERPLVYGSATGAQIALEHARAHADHCGGLLLENVALFSPAEQAAIVEDYFPDITPHPDGRHLRALWRMASRSTRYFPWFDDSPAADRRGADAPAAVTEAMVRDQLLAGPGYERAYRAAFANEGPGALRGITVPTRIVQWPDSLLGDYAKRLETAPLPPGMELRHAGCGMPARMDTMSAAADELRALRESTNS
jgi:pimeloyl-ACP methyl ester carboxylesterase